jgi:hypothetical protein
MRILGTEAMTQDQDKPVRSWRWQMTDALSQMPAIAQQWQVKDETLEQLPDNRWRIQGYSLGTTTGGWTVKGWPQTRHVSPAEAAAWLRFFGYSVPDDLDADDQTIPKPPPSPKPPASFVSAPQGLY